MDELDEIKSKTRYKLYFFPLTMAKHFNQLNILLVTAQLFCKLFFKFL